MEVTGSLQIRNDIYQAVLSYKVNGKWKTKWKSTRIKAIRVNKREAETKLKEIIERFSKELNSIPTTNIESANIIFIEFMKSWLEIVKHSIEDTTYNGYHKLIYGRMTDYFEPKNITLQNIKPKDIQDFYQYLLGFGLKGNTVTRFHANIRKALQQV